MKIPKHLGVTFEEAKKDLSKTKDKYCRGCGAKCLKKIVKMNTLFDEDTGNRIDTYMVRVTCPKKGLFRYISTMGGAHRGDTDGGEI